MEDNQNIDNIREKINNVDSEILKLLANRRKLSEDVINTKVESDKPIRDTDRETELLSSIISKGKEIGLDSHYVSKIFYDIIDDSVRLQQNHFRSSFFDNGTNVIRVAIQGIEGSYSSMAAHKFFAHFNKEIIFISKDRFDEVAEEVEAGRADFAMLPIENTTSGGINEVYDLLLHTTLSIVGEEKFQVKHCLVGTENSTIGKLEVIFAHYQAAAQCNKFLATLPDAKIQYFADTALSGKKIKEEGNSEYGAIASEEAAKLFNLKILQREIANQPENYTRFLVCSRKPQEIDSRIPTKTSLVMATAHTAGSLLSALTVFSKYDVNMEKLESRPIIGNPWEEMFYLDFAGNIKDENIQSLLDELGLHTRFLKVLGCYPAQEITKAKLDYFTGNKVNSEKSEEIKPKETEEKLVKNKKPKSYKLASRDYKPEDTIIKVNNVEIGGNNFVVIGGPCSVESHNQIFSCAKHAKESGTQILRGGCFKPRTSPYSFQGLGFDGLNELKSAGKKYDLPIITEVLAPEQVAEVALQSDILQIGARNMQNFSLLKEVGRVHRPVMLKRGMMSSVDELLNAAEYILSHGNRQVILCERGIRTFETTTRNTLDLGIIPFLKEMTHLPIIVDPSHAIGVRDKIVPLAKASKVVGAHGIMVEFHPDPPSALSDAEQALTFEQYSQMMKELYEL
ncbi:MAG: bifunctional 3-deoxy-7-phosphoheptulonate synthase/chorismate mutase [Ignavibacteriales bacterium]|nr:bifunctional 3-deoxy-7-phosphoheptulonate synthase/chorismate mutase [Ignavibacteriales bacterium]MCB9219568.1 bifunctional 3-deoxy-7-phosphoheptulonate synthase/chorismate mutase [Ignavibacteriales bacterium]MCB9257830.1 bifunctional 3-deoxy-7-phosphoheptulonate synthase/chorismate mutase [Ignavibacteriales bacterium]